MPKTGQSQKGKRGKEIVVKFIPRKGLVVFQRGGEKKGNKAAKSREKANAKGRGRNKTAEQPRNANRKSRKEGGRKKEANQPLGGGCYQKTRCRFVGGGKRGKKRVEEGNEEETTERKRTKRRGSKIGESSFT